MLLSIIMLIQYFVVDESNCTQLNLLKRPLKSLRNFGKILNIMKKLPMSNFAVLPLLLSCVLILHNKVESHFNKYCTERYWEKNIKGE